MRSTIAIGFAACLLGLAPAALPATGAFAPCAAGAASPPPLRLAACRHVQCNCRYECIRWDGNGNCIQTYRTCDICSICD
jgi:hypothetical protein